MNARAAALPMPDAAPAPAGRVDSERLADLLCDGFYMTFLLRNGEAALAPDPFRERIRAFLADFERAARRLETSPEDLYDAKFAFCALVDEVVLTSSRSLREAWGRRPLQLELFGEQLAGERFFDHLERLRANGAAKVQVLEVHHLCLLLGFQGKYRLEGSEKLGYLTARLGDEIAQWKGRRAPFAPHGAAPDRITHPLRRHLPAWVIGAVFAGLGLAAYATVRTVLEREVQETLAPYSQVVQLAPPVAYVTLTLP